jgi:ribonuclease BN (tRNA processing enzyme)
VRFTVLGKSPAFQDAGGACSGYLVEEGDYAMLVDCGSGVFAKLRERRSYAALGQILISHIHADHVLDLVPYGYALTLGPETSGGERVPLALPPRGTEALRRMVATWGSDRLIDAAFELREYEIDGRLQCGPLEVRLHQVPHFTLTHAVELIAPSGRRLVYSADCRPNSALEAAASGADVLIAEATLGAVAAPDEPLEQRGHMSATEAGELAQRAGVGRLVLTHISDQHDLERALAAASEVFSGPAELAAPGSSWEL